MEVEEVRTAEHFVEDLLSRGRTAEQIVTIAENTYWKNKVPEVKTAILKLSANFSK